MVAVVMEPEMRDTKVWMGVVGGKLGTSLYVDLSADQADEKFASGVEHLAKEICDRIAESEAARSLKAVVHAVGAAAELAKEAPPHPQPTRTHGQPARQP
eukprot:3103821-Prymnesium_polylepis.1